MVLTSKYHFSYLSIFGTTKLWVVAVGQILGTTKTRVTPRGATGYKLN